MDLSNLKPADGAVKKKKRVGRGTGSGHGKTSVRGMKGQNARSGGRKAPWFEGGQTPLVRKIPKLPGFRNPFKTEYQIVNVVSLNLFEDGATVTSAELYSKNLISSTKGLVKILGNGDLEKKLTVKAHAFSKTATQKIQAKNGQVELVQ